MHQIDFDQMIIGNRAIFSIESSIKYAYEKLSLRGLGFFVIYVGGHRYGVYSPEATMLACSFDEVRNRLMRRGRHIAPFAANPDAGKIADAFFRAIYAADQENEPFLGFSHADFSNLISSNHLQWVPDGDAAFDDGGHVLQFDVGADVRLIAFQTNEKGYAPQSLREAWLKADEFYGALQSWRDAFETEWSSMPKTAEIVKFIDR